MDIGLNYYQPVDPLRPLMHPESKERRTQKLRTERRRAEEHCLRQIKAMPEHMRWERVLKRVCLLTGVTRQELMANYRRRDFVFARYMAYYWLARLTKLSLASIATRLGRDHSTVIYGVRRYREMRLAKGWCLPPARVYS